MDEFDFRSKKEVRQQAPRSQYCLSAAQLKKFAFICIVMGSFARIFLATFLLNDIKLFPGIAVLYYLLAAISTMAFPLLAVLEVESYRHTSNIAQHIIKRLIFAVVVEVCYDIAYYGKVFYFGCQSPAFTFVFIPIALWCIDKLDDMEALTDRRRKIVRVGVTILFGFIAQRLKIEMAYCNIIIGCVFYCKLLPASFEKGVDSWGNQSASSERYVWLGCASLLYMLHANFTLYIAQIFLCRFPIEMYDGREGELDTSKYWLWYPLHLLIIWLVTCVLYGIVTG